MRRIASHRVFRFGKHERVSISLGEENAYQVVEWEDEGEIRLYPLSEEIRSTEWLPGVLVLSPFIIERRTGEQFIDFVNRLNKESMQIVQSESADSISFPHEKIYWLTPFNVAEMEFLPDTRFVCLKSV